MSEITRSPKYENKPAHSREPRERGKFLRSRAWGLEEGRGVQGVEWRVQIVALGAFATVVQKKWKERAPGVWRGLRLEGPEKVNVCGSGTLATQLLSKRSGLECGNVTGGGVEPWTASKGLMPHCAKLVDCIDGSYPYRVT